MKNFIQNTVIRKLIYLIVGFLFYAVVGMFTEAWADYPKTVVGYDISYGQSDYRFDTYQEACEGYRAYRGETWPADYQPVIITNCTEEVVDIQSQPKSWNTGRVFISKVGSCSGVESPYTDGVCIGEPANDCPAGESYNSTTNQCEVPNPCQDLKDKQTRYSTTGNTNFLQCFNGCEVERQSGSCADNAAGDTFCSFLGSYNGNSCTPAPEAPTPPPEVPTPEQDCISQGKSYATFGGTTVCVPNGTPDTPPVDKYKDKEKTTENPDGTTTETKEEVTESDGKIKTERTTTTTDSDGNEVGTQTTTEEQDKPSFCEENPNSEICKEAEESTFGGSCSSSFTCEGDAVQCAIAKKQHQSRCDDIATDSISDLGDTILQGGDSTEGQEGSFSNPKEVQIGDLDSSGFLSKSCLPDIQTSTYGTIPISRLCQGLEAAGAIVLAFAYLISLGIIFKGS